MGDTVTDNHYTVSRDDADNYKSAASSGDESDTDYVPNSDTNDDFNNNIINNNNNNNNDPNNNDVNEGEAAEVEVTMEQVSVSVSVVSSPAAAPLYCRAPGPSACPCPASYSAPAPDTAAYYQLPPPDYQELSPASLAVQPTLPRCGAVRSVECWMDPRNCSIKRLYVSLIKTA